MFILKADCEPKKGLILFHEKDMDSIELCWKLFEFDPEFTSSSNGNILDMRYFFFGKHQRAFKF